MPTWLGCRRCLPSSLGLVLGEAVLGVRFGNAGLAEVLGLSELVLILAEGGLPTNWAPCPGRGLLGCASQDLYHKDRPIERCLP